MVLSEPAAILIYLAKKAQKLIPSDLAGEAQVVRWCFAATNSVEIPLMSISMIDWVKVMDVYGNVKKYRDQCLERPAWKRTINRYEYVQAG